MVMPLTLRYAIDNPLPGEARMILKSLIAAMIVAGAVVPVMAQSDDGGPDFYEVAIRQNSSHLNIRESGSLGATVLGRVAQGAKLKNMGCTGEGKSRWCKVETDASVKGYAFGAFLKEAAGAAAMAAKAPPAFALGKLPCERSNGSPVSECDYGVVRVGAGKATLQVYWPDGGKRMFGIYGGAAASKDGPVRAKLGADGAYDLTHTPTGMASEHYTVAADIIGAK